jgi:hypothetical protein
MGLVGSRMTRRKVNMTTILSHMTLAISAERFVPISGKFDYLHRDIISGQPFSI